MRFPTKLDAPQSEAVVLDRRSVLSKGCMATFAAVTVPLHFARAALCQDPEELSSTDYSFRKYVEFTESWPNKNETCRHCAAFVPGPSETACGTCRAIAGSINPEGHCTGWERKKPGI